MGAHRQGTTRRGRHAATADRPHRRTTAAAAGVLGALLSVSAVWMNSYAAFSGQTDNPGNNWKAGAVSLSDDDGGTALFNATGLVPGTAGERCIVVKYTGDVAATVKLYATGYGTTNAMGSHLDLAIHEGGGSTAADCTGFTASPAAAIYSGTAEAFGGAGGNTDWTTGVPSSFAPTGANQTKTYRIRYTLNGATPTSVEGGTVGLGFTWEAQNS
jgi:hypothetical protein